MFSYNETITPNDITVYYDHSSVNLTDELLKLEIKKYSSDGTLIGTLSRLFYASGISGFLNPDVAILLSAVTVFFSLSFVAIRYIFGYFGIASTIIGLAILTQAPANQYVILMEVIEVIILVFIVLLWKEEYAKIT